MNVCNAIQSDRPLGMGLRKINRNAFSVVVEAWGVWHSLSAHCALLQSVVLGDSSAVLDCWTARAWQAGGELDDRSMTCRVNLVQRLPGRTRAPVVGQLGVLRRAQSSCCEHRCNESMTASIGEIACI